MDIVLLKLVLSLLLIALLPGIFYYRAKIHKDSLAGIVLTGAWVLLRVVPLLIIYVFLHQEARSDVTGFLVGWGNHARQGELIYRDFVCTYSPFFPYLIGLSMEVWEDPRAIVGLMVVMEGVAVGVAYQFYKPALPRPELVTRLLLYLCMPASLILCVVSGQEDVWAWLFVALAGWGFYRKQSYVVYGSLLALGLLTTKATFVLIFPALLVLAEKRSGLFSVLAVWGIVTLVVLYSLVGLEFTQPLSEADTLRAPNLLSVLNPWFFDAIGVGKSFWNWIGLVITLILSCWTAWRWRGTHFQEAISRVFMVTYATLMVVQQSAYGNYIFFFLLPLVLIIVDWRDRWQVTLLLAFNVLCVVHPSYWWRMGNPKYLQPSDIWASGATLLDYAMQLSLVALAAYFIFLAGFGARREAVVGLEATPSR